MTTNYYDSRSLSLRGDRRWGKNRNIRPGVRMHHGSHSSHSQLGATGSTAASAAGPNHQPRRARCALVLQSAGDMPKAWFALMRSKQKEAGGCLVGWSGWGIFPPTLEMRIEKGEIGLLVLCHFDDCWWCGVSIFGPECDLKLIVNIIFEFVLSKLLVELELPHNFERYPSEIYII